MNAIVVQCGGPTPVINASLGALIAAWQRDGGGRLFGARWGLHGFAHHDWVELTQIGADTLTLLSRQPGAALGSGRYRLVDDEIPATLQTFHDNGIGIVFMIGGNGTMGAAGRLLDAAEHVAFRVDGLPLHVIGVPKTIDNDLFGTHVAPGYPSAARFIAQTTHNIGLDLTSMTNFDHIAIFEVMGRHTGWLAAAAALARSAAGDPPHLILLPEAPVDEDELVAAIAATYQQKGVCLLVASEGIRDWSHSFYAEKIAGAGKDASGQTLLSLSGGVAAYLARLVQDRLSLRCRQIRPDTIQRSASTLVSPIDRLLAEKAGAAAVAAALAGETGVMVGLVQEAEGWSTQLTSVNAVHGRERHVPAEFMAPEHFDVTRAFESYARPLIGALDLDAVQLTVHI